MADSKENSVDELSLDELIAKLNTIDLSNNTMQSSSDWLASDTITLPSSTYGMSDINYGAIPSLSISASTLSQTGQNTVWTTNTTGPGYTIGSMGSSPMTVGASGTMSLQGEKADIDINGKSMVAWMEKVEERLNILTPNPELEKEWDDLRRLGERYRKLEKKCKEKADMWEKLKSMPKLNINI